ncbi:MAG TPA: hypothetical protein VGF77_10860 [Allosphingosinicella sp.]|jgi:hypothetical protein
MPLFKFHVFNDDQTIDREGRDLPDLDAARAYAIECARAIMAEEIKAKGDIDLRHWIEIEDQQGEMHVVPFDSAVRVDR